MINRLISFLLFFIFSYSFSFNNEITGKYVYDVDINENELYMFNNLLELKTYDLETGILKYSRQIIANNPDQLNNRTWRGLYTGDLNLSPDVMNGLMNSLTLKKLSNGEFYLFHNGGGLVLSLENDELNRVDNSFPFMNKFFGDFINSAISRAGGGLAETLGGPVVGLANDFMELTIGNISQLAQGKDTNAGKELVRFIARYAPGSSLWYSRLAFERLVLDQLQLQIDPKARKRFRNKQRRIYKEYNQKYWWKPGKTTPSRPPNIGVAIGD